MGDLVEGICLSTEEIKSRQSELTEKTLSYWEDKLSKDSSSGDRVPRIQHSGSELELQIVDSNRRLKDGYHAITDEVSTLNISPELTQHLIEVKQPESDLHHPGTNFSEIVDCFENLISNVQMRAWSKGLEVLTIGGHPAFNPEEHNSVSDNIRYSWLIDTIDKFGTNRVSMNFPNHSKESSGTLYEAFGSTVQTTIQVPHHFVDVYADAATLVQPLFLLWSAASPFIERKLLNLDSGRVILLPQSVVGKSKEELSSGASPRMRTLEYPLSRDLEDEKIDASITKRFMRAGVSKGVAKYIADVCRDSHLLLTEEEIRQDKMPGFTCWPWTKVRYDKIHNSEGVGIELRVGEHLPTARENASLVTVNLAVVQAVAEDIINNRISMMPGTYAQYNLEVCAAQRAPEQFFDVFWPDENGNPVKHNSISIVNYLANRCVQVLKENHSPEDIANIMNPCFNRVGLHYNHRMDSIKDCASTKTPAQNMRSLAFEKQPDVLLGGELTDDTIEYMLRNL